MAPRVDSIEPRVSPSTTSTTIDLHLTNKSDFAGFVDWVLAHRGNDADMEYLKIHISGGHQARASPEQVNKWLRYAAQHVVGSVDIDIGYYGRQSSASGKKNPADEEEQQVIPSHGRAGSMSLVLPNHRFPIHDPAASSGARHEALTKLELFSLSFSEDGRELSDFVACCPRLRRLLICSPKGLRQLVLGSEALASQVDQIWKR